MKLQELEAMKESATSQMLEDGDNINEDNVRKIMEDYKNRQRELLKKRTAEMCRTDDNLRAKLEERMKKKVMTTEIISGFSKQILCIAAHTLL